MPNLDLGPNDYRKHDPRTGRWRLPDDPKLCRNVFFGCMAILAYIFWNRQQVTSDLLFGITALVAWAAGGLFALWLKDVP